MNKILKLRVQIAKWIIWKLENFFFYPKLRKLIKKLSNQGVIKENCIIDVGGHVGESAFF
jgi:hypothetical protein